jgi:hypothetical protein
MLLLPPCLQWRWLWASLYSAGANQAQDLGAVPRALRLALIMLAAGTLLTGLAPQLLAALASHATLLEKWLRVLSIGLTSDNI